MTLKHKIMSNNVSQFFSILAPLFLSTLISMECRYCPTTPEEFQRYQNEYMWIKLYGRDDPSDDLGSFRNGHHTSGEENVIKTEEEKRGDDNKKYDDLYKQAENLPAAPLPTSPQHTKLEKKEGKSNGRIDIWNQLQRMEEREKK
ncbi:uncharacterized protein LOC128673748 isoform X3 [Plodia interpunctella]|uniref:uncharacterized protein LOC128673748 isoform X3 n=1 Tax=Plodia interpunctella TaxID=58824 RepID=UPI002368994A|nr:uncharacterized protein LOC128673748 isoform X3 [Plodia interpunctella]